MTLIAHKFHQNILERINYAFHVNPKEKIKNDFIIILALGLFLNYAIYLWYGSLDMIHELIFRVPERFYMGFDLEIQFFVLIGTLIMLIAFTIEIIRSRHFSLILLTIVSLFQVIVAGRDFLYWLDPEIYAGPDLVFVKIFLDFIQLCLLIAYLPRFRKWRGKGNRFLRAIFILIILGIALTFAFIFIFARFFIPTIYVNIGISGPVNLWLILVCCLMLLPGLIPIGIISFIQPASHIKVSQIKGIQMPVTEPRQVYMERTAECPKCATINGNNDVYCMECGFDLNRLGM